MSDTPITDAKEVIFEMGHPVLNCTGVVDAEVARKLERKLKKFCLHATMICSAHRIPDDPDCRVCFPLPRISAEWFDIAEARGVELDAARDGLREQLRLNTELNEGISATRENFRKVVLAVKKLRGYKNWPTHSGPFADFVVAELAAASQELEGWEKTWKLSEEHGQHQKARAIAAEQELAEWQKTHDEQVNTLLAQRQDAWNKAAVVRQELVRMRAALQYEIDHCVNCSGKGVYVMYPDEFVCQRCKPARAALQCGVK